MSELTDADLSRLLTLQFVHGGGLRHIPHGVGVSFGALEGSGMVVITEEELIDAWSVLAAHAEISESGKRVVAAGMAAMRMELIGK